MLEDYITIVSALLTFTIYFVTFFLAIEIRRRLINGIVPTLNYVIIALFFIMIARIIALFVTIEIFPPYFNYVKEIFIFLFSIFVLLAAIDLYRFITDCMIFKKTKTGIKKRSFWEVDFRNYKKKIESRIRKE